MFVCPECAASQPEKGFCPNDGTPLVPTDGDPLIGSQIGQFRMSTLLGVGGMGRVYKGVNPTISSRVAIKVLSRDYVDNAELVERFFAEARAVNVIRHENIVNVLDLAKLPDGRPYIIMEYLDGAPLSSTIANFRQLPLGTVARVMTEVLSALAAAHEKQIIHRDLKPDNIFISPQGRAKVLDFGIAKLRPDHSGRSGPTRDGSLMGTPHYMSPEQAQAKLVDARTDIYAVGAILYECVTGQPPFQADSLFDLLKQQIEVPPTPPHFARPDLPQPYEALILRCLAKSAEHRFATAAELSAALSEVSQNLPPYQWAPIGKAERAGVPVIRSMPTPEGSSSPHAGRPGPSVPAPVAGMLPTPPGHAGPPTPAASGQVAPRPELEKRGGKAKWIIGTIVLASAAAVGIAVYHAQASDAVGANGSEVAEESGNSGESVSTSHAGGGKSDKEASLRRDGSAGDAGEKADGEKHRDGKALVLTSDGDKGERPVEANQAGDKAGSGQTSGTVRTIGPGRTELDTPNAKAFDVTGYIPEATRAARAVFEDAILVRIDAEGVYPNGKADLTLDGNFSVLYRFRSRSRAVRPKDLPLGVEHKPTCLFYVSVQKDTITNYVVTGFPCDYAEVGPPKCSVAGVWQKAIRGGAPSKNAVAEVGYWADPKGVGRWSFSIGHKNSSWIQDDC
jgi:serine/threonine protein kinase